MEDTDKNKVSNREKGVLEYWKQKNIFEKTEGTESEPFVFFDGPPFANGEPHYGHMLASSIKDAIPRYQVMNGKSLRRRWGWDCHGLPVENLTEKELGLKGKKDIEEYGVEKFNEATRVNIMRDAGIWEERIPRLGRFVDMKDDYKTMDPSYTESVWWAFKNLYDKNLIYKGFKSMHLCPRCGTTLSNFEVNLGYKDITDLAVTVPFEIIDEPNTYVLAWTTTPWTLPGNMALAVNSEIDYVEIVFPKKEGSENKKYILAKDRLTILQDEYEVESEFKGGSLVGKKYKPLFPYYENIDLKNKENAWKIYSGDYVTVTDGTGIVHLAPAFGEDDLKLAQKNNIPIVHHVGMDGKFKKEIEDLEGLLVKPKDDKEKGIDHTDTDVEVIKYLARSGKLFAKEKIIHSYPLCWRCDTPLLNFATDSWFVKVTDIKKKLVSENNKIHWVPESIGKYRFGNWLENAHDWAISRSRYWGAPIPVWESEDKSQRLVLGSLDDWRENTKKSGNKYFLMRHGEAQSNVGNFTSSSYKDKVHLTEKGKGQIAESSAKLKDEKIDMIFASDFMRTKETAILLAKQIGFSEDNIIFDKRLREIDTGDFAGKANGEYHAYFSSIEEKFVKSAPNGESLQDLKKRVMEFMYEIEEKYKDKKIVIVTHEYAVWMLWTGMMGWSNKVSAKDKETKDDFIKTGEIMSYPFVPLPHNREFELDFHKPYIDEIEVVGKDGSSLKRVPDVFDCWFESGSMPYAQDHYPFNKEKFDPEKNLGYPADFIAEGLDQTRGWFYSLLVLGVALFDRSPYKNVIVNGLVLAEDGQKMSKRLKNYPDPMEVIEKYGADAVRLYMLSSPIVRGEELRFSEKGVAEIANKIIGRILNVHSFLTMYGETEDLSFDELQKKSFASPHVLDKWIVARLEEVIKQTTDGMNDYALDDATRPFALFVDDLSTWYLRRGRDRFKGDNKEDRTNVSNTTRYVLLQLCKIMAPFTPFVSEFLYSSIKTKDSLDSVHLESWPKNNQEKFEQSVIDNMKIVRDIVSQGLLLRAKSQIKVRQPLAKLEVKDNYENINTELIELIKDEVNVKEVILGVKDISETKLDTNITTELKEEGDVREIIRAIQDERKKMNLLPEDTVEVAIHMNSSAFDIEKYRDLISKATGARTFSIGFGEMGDQDGELKVNVKKSEATN